MATAEMQVREAPKTPQKQENKMGVMPIGRLVLTMSLPMMISMLVQALYNIVDSLFVARVNADAFNALSLAFPFQNLMIAVGVGTGVGVNANLSRALGEKKFERANKFARNGIFLAICSAIVVMVLALCFTRLYFSVQTDNEQVIEYGTQYLFIVSFFCVGSFMQIMNERLLQATGKTIFSMCSQGVGSIINLILDPLLIFGIGFFPKLGVTGAAIATVIGQCCAATFGIILNTTKNKEISINMRRFKPEIALIGKIYSIGVPSIIMTAITSVMTFALNLILTTFGAIAGTLQSVLGAYFKLQSFIFMPVFGLNNGTVPIISYNYGAGKRSRVIKTMKVASMFAMIIMLLGLLIMQVMPELMLKIFDANDMMIEYGVPALRIISLAFIIAGINVVLSSTFQSLGKPISSMIVSITRQLVVLVPSAFLLSLTGNPTLVWWSFPIAEVASLIMCLIMLKRTYTSVIKNIPDNV